MFNVLGNSWALLLGILLLMIGNGLQGPVLGVRASAEGFDATTMGYVMSAYFIGFLGGAQMAPRLLRRVGHVRVFAALASLISAVFILYAAIVDPIAWFFMRLLVGFCYSGVYVVAESWLNESASNENRGLTMSFYLAIQMLGIVIAQGLINVADPGGYDLFIIMSVLVSVSFAPILLSISPTPMFTSTRRMSLARLFQTSPLGCVGMFSVGIVFGSVYGMAPVYATREGLSNSEISIFLGAIYLGGMICQFPVGWLSDRIDRRLLIASLTAICAGAGYAGTLMDGSFYSLVLVGAAVGGTSNPLYSLLAAYVNDYLEHEDMASASGGLILLNGVGAMGAPIIVGYVLSTIGNPGYFLFIALVMSLTTLYALYRMTVRPSTPVAETMPVGAMSPVASFVSAEIACEAAIQQMAGDHTEQDSSKNPE